MESNDINAGTAEEAAYFRSRGGTMHLDGSTRRPLTDERKRGAWTMLEALRMFQKETGRQDMPMQYLTSFLLVAIEEGLGVGEYASKAGVSKSVMSRHLLDIGDRTRTHEVGFGLVTYRPNPHELRRHEVFLTPKGRALAERILAFWQMGGK